MIVGFLLFCAGLIIWGLKEYNRIRLDLNLMKQKEVKNEAETVIKSKTAIDLVNDFNKRYPSESDRKNDSN
jgi:hypothetical protein